MTAPTIADTEIHWLRPPEQFCVGRLVLAGKFADRALISAERKEVPSLRIVIAEWDAGIVLDDGCAVGENEVARRREIAGVQQIGRALDQAVAGRERLAKLQKATRPHPRVGKIGREIIERLLTTLLARKGDAHPVSSVRTRALVAGMDRALVVEGNRRDLANGLSRARKEHVEDRQRARDLPGMQIHLHMLGDEEAEAQDRA